MLPRERRLRTKNINRLFGRTDTQKIVAYPFIFFVWKKIQPKAGSTTIGTQSWKSDMQRKHAQRGIQISNKFSKSAVKRHVLKRTFYDMIERLVPHDIGQYYLLAVPQKTRQEEMTQLLATADKTTIVSTIQKQYIASLSLFLKRLWSSNESKQQSHRSNNAKDAWKKKKPSN